MSLKVFGFVFLSTEQSGRSFLEEVLGRAGVVEVRGGVAAASRQSVWCDTLMEEKHERQNPAAGRVSSDSAKR